MTRLSTFLFSALLILAFACKKTDLQTSTSQAASPSLLMQQSAANSKSGPSANGQGTLTVGDQSRHFAFHVMTAPDGTVSGSGELTYTAGGVKSKFDITCMTVLGNQASMQGVITDGDAIPVGYPIWFKVIDNGEGANASPDQMTLATYWTNGAPVGCGLNYFSTTLYPVEGGNIQVKP